MHNSLSVMHHFKINTAQRSGLKENYAYRPFYVLRMPYKSFLKPNSALQCNWITHKAKQHASYIHFTWLALCPGVHFLLHLL